jgi:hypothetical protein
MFCLASQDHLSYQSNADTLRYLQHSQNQAHLWQKYFTSIFFFSPKLRLQNSVLQRNVLVYHLFI